MIDTIRDLKSRSSRLRENARKLDAAIDSLQATCEHDWIDTGYDPRGSGTQYYKCSKCDLEKTE